jgi:hypothetical protein
MSAPDLAGPAVRVLKGVGRASGLAKALTEGSRAPSLPAREPFCVDWQLSDARGLGAIAGPISGRTSVSLSECECDHHEEE